MTSRLKVENDPGSHFLRTPNDFIRSDVPPAVKAAVLYLASHSDGFILYDRTAARELGMARNTFAKAVDRAVALGNVTRELTGDLDRYGNPIYSVTVTLKTCDKACSISEHGHVQKLSTKKTTNLEDHNFSNFPSTAVDGLEEIKNIPSTGVDGPGVKPDRTKTPTHLPADWAPSAIHRRSFNRRQGEGTALDDVTLECLADYFRTQQRDKRLRDWDKSFGAYINSYAEDRFEIDFPSFPAEDEEAMA